MGAYLPDLNTIIAAGYNPKTGLPVKISSKTTLKEDIKKFLRVIDEQDACNRFVWFNVPCNLTSQEIERMLYYKGQLCFFYSKDLDEFYFLPYTLNGNLDAYGRFRTIKPVAITNGLDEKSAKAVNDYFSTLKLKVHYAPKAMEDVDLDDFENGCVLLHDYTKQISQTNIPRQILNDSILDTMADCVPFMRTNLLTSSGINGVRVSDADQKEEVLEGGKSLETAALSGIPWVPILAPIEMQELTGGNVDKPEEYMLAMQSLDNLRLSGYGIDNGGLFEKKAHELQSEADINGGPVGLVLQDGLSIRQNFCLIANSIFGTSMWCEPAQNIIGADIDGDGLNYDRNEEGEHSGVETDEGGEDDASRI